MVGVSLGEVIYVEVYGIGECFFCVDIVGIILLMLL